ncbi:MAG: RRXRR domain-containing protein [Alphaproteobacteria bacterium]|nr:RRXRR domain-containing protein [Alphaproteobacteria bacterium]
MSVFVPDKRHKPLMPCFEKLASRLLQRRKDVVHRRFPFTIRLKERAGGGVQPVPLKIDPGADVTGVAIARETSASRAVLHRSEIAHKGRPMRQRMQQRAAYRRRRRDANLRYRASRYDNRRRPEGWLWPSLRPRVDNTRRGLTGIAGSPR